MAGRLVGRVVPVVAAGLAVERREQRPRDAAVAALEHAGRLGAGEQAPVRGGQARDLRQLQARRRRRSGPRSTAPTSRRGRRCARRSRRATRSRRPRRSRPSRGRGSRGRSASPRSTGPRSFQSRRSSSLSSTKQPLRVPTSRTVFGIVRTSGLDVVDGVCTRDGRTGQNSSVAVRTLGVDTPHGRRERTLHPRRRAAGRARPRSRRRRRGGRARPRRGDGRRARARGSPSRSSSSPTASPDDVLPRRRTSSTPRGRRWSSTCRASELRGLAARRRRPLLRRARGLPHRGGDRRGRRALSRVPAPAAAPRRARRRRRAGSPSSTR